MQNSHVVCLVVYPYMQEESHCITSLGLACEAGHKAVAELLIFKGAKVNYQDNVRLVELSRILRYLLSFQIGFTPLHWASRNGHLDVVELLIEKDAQIVIPSKV